MIAATAIICACQKAHLAYLLLIKRLDTFRVSGLRRALSWPVYRMWLLCESEEMAGYLTFKRWQNKLHGRGLKSPKTKLNIAERV